jgi:hypothetical protein
MKSLMKPMWIGDNKFRYYEDISEYLGKYYGPLYPFFKKMFRNYFPLI